SNNTKLVVESGLLKTFRTFQTNMEALKLEEENYTLAKENVDIALERYRLGSSSALELKIAQQSYEDADNRVVLARYATKISETELMRLNGILVKAIK
ncbi:MAG: TolC family protein, partial [Bacteroidota bacterium]